MSAVTLRGFAPGENVSAYRFAIGEVWTRQMNQTPPSAALATVAATATGQVTFDLPDQIEYLALGVTSRRTKQFINATTQGGSVPLVPAV